MMLLAQRTRSDVEGSWRNRPRHRTIRHSIAKIHGDNRLESEPLPRCERHSKVEQIQRSILYQQYPCSNLRLETIELENAAEEVVAPCGQCSSADGLSVHRLCHRSRDETCSSSSLFTRSGTIGLHPFRLRERKVDGISGGE
jgi:hypothetical protein